MASLLQPSPLEYQPGFVAGPKFATCTYHIYDKVQINKDLDNESLEVAGLFTHVRECKLF